MPSGGDASITRRGPMRGPTMGRLIRASGGGDVFLLDINGSRWPERQVSYLQGAFGSGGEGERKGFRIWEFDPRGRVLIEGEWLLIDFLEGGTSRPIVRGGVVTADAANTLGRLPSSLDDNSWRLRVAGRTAGSETSAAELAALNGTLTLLGTERVLLQGPGVEVRVDSVVRVGSVLAQPLMTDAGVQALAAALAEVVAGLALVPFPAPITAAFVAAAQSGAYTTTKLEAE